MRLFGKQADDREAAAHSGIKVVWFGSYSLGPDELEEVACGTGPWWSGDELAGEAPTTMGGGELDPRAAGYN